jgi:hypothetical protein
MKVVELKEVMNARFAEVDARFEGVYARFAQVDRRFDTLETRLASEHETTRRHMEMLVEQLRAEFRLGLDRMLATDRQLASLDAANAREHTTIAGVLDDHEVRIRALERPSPPHDDTPPGRR